MHGFKTGTNVRWNWGNGTGEGEITKRYTEKVTRTIQGTDVTREASEDEPAYLITQDDGAEVLKSHTEVEIAD